MQHQGNLTEPGVNVPLFREHIEEYICSHEVGTLNGISTVFTKEDKQILKDKEGVYHYKDYTFEIRDGWFIHGSLKFKLPQRTEISTFQRLALSLWMPITLEDKDTRFDVQKTSFRELLHLLTMLALKDLKIISGSFSLRKCLAYGNNVFEAYFLAVSGSGRIQAKQKYIRWLNEQDTNQLKADLFKTSKYQVGTHSMEYKPTDLAEQIFKSTFNLLKAIDFVHCDMELQSLDFIVDLNDLEQIRLRDVMLLLGNCIGYQSGFMIRPQLTDIQSSRVYSAFTSIGSKTRKLLGFYNYDIGAALQTICLQLVKDPSLYPLHQELMNDKKAFRVKVQDETDKDLQWVKKELSKVDNLDSMPKKYNEYPVLKMYYAEAQLLRKEIVNDAEDVILSRATDFAKPRYEKVWNANKKAYDFVPDGKKESSIFFFIWTQWERQIRESMMSCFNEPAACHQVHDAVYSRQIIEPKAIEKKVLEDTGFTVQISTD